MLQAIYIILAPALAIWMTRHSRFAAFLGPVVFAYLFGILWPVIAMSLPMLEHQASISDTLRDAAIPLAIPLLLFTLNIRGWLSNARDTAVSFFLAILALTITATLGWFLIGRELPLGTEITGMLTGMYSGGAPNMAVVHRSLDLPNSLYIEVNAIDVMFGAGYFLFLVAFAAPFYGLFLRRPETAQQSVQQTNPEKFRAADFIRLGMAFLASALIVAAAALLSQVILGSISVPLVMLAITVTAVAASFFKPLQTASLSYPAGYYLVMIFCVAIGSTIQIDELLSNPGAILGLVAFVFLGTIALHLALAKLFGIDRDTFIITSTAALYGPPFIPPVASALRNPAMLISGLTAGLVGYAVGNFLGLGMVYALRSLG